MGIVCTGEYDDADEEAYEARVRQYMESSPGLEMVSAAIIAWAKNIKKMYAVHLQQYLPWRTSHLCAPKNH